MTITNFSRPTDQVWSSDVYIANISLNVEPHTNIVSVLPSFTQASPDFGLDLLASGRLMMRGYVEVTNSIPGLGNGVEIVRMPVKIKTPGEYIVTARTGAGTTSRPINLVFRPDGSIWTIGDVAIDPPTQINFSGITFVPNSELFVASSI